jgi:hypothetical protein
MSRQINRTPSRRNRTMGAAGSPPNTSRIKSGSPSSCRHICISSHLVCPSLCCCDGEPSLCAQHAPGDEMTTHFLGCYYRTWPILPGNIARPAATGKQTRESDKSSNVKISASQLRIEDPGEGAGSPLPGSMPRTPGRAGAHIHGGPSELGQHQPFQQTEWVVSGKHTSSERRSTRNIRREGRKDLQIFSFAPRRLTTNGPETVVVEGPAAPGVVDTPSLPITDSKPPPPVVFTGHRPARQRPAGSPCCEMVDT